MWGNKIAFLGAGNMAAALIEGIIAARLMEPENIIISDSDKKNLGVRSEALKVKPAATNREAVEWADVIILAVKPGDIEGLLSEIKSFITSNKLVISIAAGVTTSYIEELLAEKRPVIRVMPNISVAVEEGASAFSVGKYTSPEEEGIVRTIFGAVGKIVKIEENLMDTVTALSGSGPAYIFYIIASFVATAVSLGLDKATATTLIIQTVLGAAKLLQTTGQDSEALVRKVASKGGTTEAALSVFKDAKLKETLDKALRAALKRCKELK
jgi:pyrroline-5-carboxylate reductase